MKAVSGKAVWIETALWIKTVPAVELMVHAALIPLIPCAAILSVAELM